MSVRDKLGRIIKVPGQLAKDVRDAAVMLAKTGQISAQQQVIDARLAICGGCDKFDGKTCRVCGCHMKWKVALAASVCPIGKWK